MKPPVNILLVLMLIFLSEVAISQSNDNTFRIMFYNVENLFDTHDDSITIDEEFLPDGDRRWDFSRLTVKLDHIAKVIIACGGWEPPAVVGFCEIENRQVVEKLLMKPVFEKFNYKIIHKESPDERGIDVSMIYNSDRFKPVKYRYIPLVEKGKTLETREILYVAGVPEFSSDTIHLFFNHWPSRYGGYLETAGLRELAAKTLRSEVDKLLKEYREPKIIITGDFNDQPTDQSIIEILRAGGVRSYPESDKLINLSSELGNQNTGTLKYQSQWLVYDQIIVSGSLLSANDGVFCKRTGAAIFKNEYLLEKDETNGGLKPFRTYVGFKYNGGFSDHLPVFLDLLTDRAINPR